MARDLAASETHQSLEVTMPELLDGGFVAGLDAIEPPRD